MRYKKLKIQILSILVSLESTPMSDAQAQTLFRVCPKGIKSDSNESKLKKSWGDIKTADNPTTQQETSPAPDKIHRAPRNSKN